MNIGTIYIVLAIESQEKFDAFVDMYRKNNIVVSDGSDKADFFENYFTYYSKSGYVSIEQFTSCMDQWLETAEVSKRYFSLVDKAVRKLEELKAISKKMKLKKSQKQKKNMYKMVLANIHSIEPELKIR